MTDKNIFRIWAPLNVKWIDWVRPVPFMGISTIELNHSFSVTKVNNLTSSNNDTAIIIDLPNHESVLVGLGYAQLGYRPIPLFNGTNQQKGSMSLVDNSGIQSAMLWGTSVLKEIEINQSAPPVFLLDSNRLLRYKMSPSVYDNSWDIYDQDIPSGDYFLGNGIKKIVVRGEKVQRDLQRVLYKLQKKGLDIYITDGFEEPKKIDIKKPPKKDKFH